MSELFITARELSFTTLKKFFYLPIHTAQPQKQSWNENEIQGLHLAETLRNANIIE